MHSDVVLLQTLSKEAVFPDENPPPTLDDTWPQPDPRVFTGVMGDFVGLLEPHTEADPIAVLLQLHTAFGNVIGRHAHFRAEADRHSLNLFGVLVGETAKGRKGTSWGYVKHCFESIDPQWSDHCIQTGLSSGEGLIYAVRDPRSKREPIREGRRVIGYQEIIDDHGVEDKRLMLIESEFASPLRVARREGNTLSPLIRHSWDSGDLRSLTKQTPIRATQAHISILGHITKAELLGLVDLTDAYNGLFNRFLWVCVRRSKCLPEGGQLATVNTAPIIKQLKQATEFAKQVGELTRDPEARELWHAVYPVLSEGESGLTGAILSRSEAQVMRLACLYAVEDRSTVVRVDHLQAALALWRYCEDSARYIFGDRMENSDANRLLSHLRLSPNGMTRTEIRDFFARNRTKDQIDNILNYLEKLGLIWKELKPTQGRPTEIWKATELGTTNTT